MNVPVHLLISIEEGLRRELEVLRDTTHGNAGRDNILTSLEQCKIRLLDLKRYVNSGVNDTDLDAFYRNHPNTLLRVKGELEKMNYGYNNPTYGATASFQNVVQPQNVGWSNMQRVQPQMYPQQQMMQMQPTMVPQQQMVMVPQQQMYQPQPQVPAFQGIQAATPVATRIPGYTGSQIVNTGSNSRYSKYSSNNIPTMQQPQQQVVVTQQPVQIVQPVQEVRYDYDIGSEFPPLCGEGVKADVKEFSTNDPNVKLLSYLLGGEPVRKETLNFIVNTDDLSKTFKSLARLQAEEKPGLHKLYQLESSKEFCVDAIEANVPGAIIGTVNEYTTLKQIANKLNELLPKSNTIIEYLDERLTKYLNVSLKQIGRWRKDGCFVQIDSFRADAAKLDDIITHEVDGKKLFDAITLAIESLRDFLINRVKYKVEDVPNSSSKIVTISMYKYVLPIVQIPELNIPNGTFIASKQSFPDLTEWLDKVFSISTLDKAKVFYILNGGKYIKVRKSLTNYTLES